MEDLPISLAASLEKITDEAADDDRSDVDMTGVFLTKKSTVQVERSFNPRVDYNDVLLAMSVEFRKKWEKIEPSPVTGLSGHILVKVLATGNFGVVNLATNKNSPKMYYAVKTMLKDQIVKLHHVQQIINEKKVLYSNNFPVLLSLEFSTKDMEYLYLGLPFMVGGDLFNYHRKQKKFKEDAAKFYAAQVFLGLEYLHYMSIIYRDLKPENIVIDSRGYIKLADFGFAKLVEERTLSLCGTPEYLPPEIIKSKPYRSSVDWWAFGIFLYEMVFGMSPFANYSSAVLVMYNKICVGQYKMPATFSDELQHLIFNLLQVDVTKRFGGDNVRFHKWFAKTDWCGLLNQNITTPYVPAVKDESDFSHFPSCNVEKKRKKRSQTPRHMMTFSEF